MLRPRRSDPPRTLEQFRDYTRSWERCAAEEPTAGFRVWATDEGPPSHSVPAHMVAKAAARLGEEAFESIHERLLDAYFRKNRDISDDDTLRVIWTEADLPIADSRPARTRISSRRSSTNTPRRSRTAPTACRRCGSATATAW